MSALRNFQIRSIQLKIALWAGLCLLLATAAITAYSVMNLRDTAIAAAEDRALAEARTEAGAVKAEVEVALDAARTLAQALTAVKRGDNPLQLSRDEVNAMLRQVTAENPDFVGTYTLWEPNAFDGRDAEFAGQAPYDQTGRFIAYWNRNERGEIRVETPLDYEVEGPGDYYQLPKKTLKECITEPYLYPVQGKDVLMTSLVVPIIVDGEFYGITGVDLALDTLQQRADAADLYDGAGTLVLISYEGSLAGVTGQPDLVGEPATALHADFENDLSLVQNGQTHVEYQGDDLEVFVPIHFGHTTTPWSVNLLVPGDKITAEATTLMWALIAIGGLLIFGALVLLWVLAGQIAKPVKAITAVAQTVAAGNLEVESDVRSSDETGVLASAFNTMIVRLREMIGKEQDQREYLETTVEKYVAYAAKVGEGNLTLQLDLDGTGRGDTDEPLLVLGRQLNTTTAAVRGMLLQIREAANNMNSAAAEIQAAAIQQTAGASEQSAAITQTTTTVDEVKTLADQAVARAQEVATAAQRTVEISHAGQQSIRDTVDSMGLIKGRVEGIAENTLALSEQTQQIGEIIDTVNTIASQSNMLALNASVEAARAGEHGKGFAAVAQEVRALADQSRQATAQVKTILSDIQQATNSTVMATEEGTKGVDAGLALISQMEEVIQQLASAITESAQTAAQVVAGGQQQASGVDQIAVAMTSINQATVQSLASTRQVERAAQDLNELARGLTTIVAQYQI